MFKIPRLAVTYLDNQKQDLLFGIIAIAILALSWGAQDARGDTLVVGGICGPTIQGCIDSAIAGDTVEIPVGTYNESLTLTEAVSLQGSGASPGDTVVSANSLAARVLRVEGASIDSSVVIDNLTFKDGVATGVDLIERNGGGILILGGAQPTIQHVVIRDNSAIGIASDGGGLLAELGSPLTLHDVSFLNNSATVSGGGAEFRDDVTITDSLFEGNESTHNVGGAINTVGLSDISATSFMNISGTSFMNNEANSSGAGLISRGGAISAFETDLTIRDSYFEDNQCQGAECDGGAVHLLGSFKAPVLTLEDTNFINNMAGRNGGAVFVRGAGTSVILMGGTFEGNDAGGDGGGLICHSLTAVGTSFISNTAVDQGGGAIVGQGGLFDAGVTATNVNFEGNTARTGGGLAVRFFVPAVTLNTTFFVENMAIEDGGGLWIEALANADIHGGIFDGNTAGNDGGGAFIGASGDLNTHEVIFSGNTAGNNGGGAFVKSGDVMDIGSEFHSNIANAPVIFFNEGGGGLHIAFGSLTADDTSFVSNLAPLALGGGAMIRGAAVLSGVYVEGNSSGRHGGGVFALGTLSIAGGSQFIGNDAGLGGGGGAWGNSDTTVTESVFRWNSAPFGGGLWAGCNSCIVDLTLTEFTSNTGTTAGGGVAATGEVIITDSLLQGNHSDGRGGGLFGSFGDITVTRTDFLENTATDSGGGIWTFSIITTVVDSVFRGNTSDAEGGGLHTNGFVVVNGASSFTGNTAVQDGGGVWANSGITATGTRFDSNVSDANGGGLRAGFEITLTDTHFQYNMAGNDGGGAYGAFRAFVTNSQFHLNEATGEGGALWFKNRGTISGSVFAHNIASMESGGGIYREAKLTQILTIETSVFDTNISGMSGGGAYLTGGVTVENTTLSGNVATTSGGAIYLGPVTDLSLANVTIADNTNASVAATAAPATVNWLNTIVSGACALSNATINSIGGNLESTGDTCGFTDGTDQTGVTTAALNLGGLEDNGGATLTHALLPLSTGIDNGVIPCPGTDQRGISRIDGLCDAGAYESSAAVLDIKPGNDPNSINCSNENQLIAVALLTSGAFDATTVDHTTVTFEGAGETHLDKKTGEIRRHEKDVDDDGDIDLVFHFFLRDTALSCDSTVATLIGMTFSGDSIEVTDFVRMVLPLPDESSIDVDEVTGGTLTFPSVRGFSITVSPGSSTFADGGKSGTLSLQDVVIDNSQLGVAATFIMVPGGVRFDPPAKITFPNSTGLPPGEVTDMYSFDHDLGEFVIIGSGTVSEDGSVVVSDPGVGIVVSG